jgi:hypothetical protein
VPLLRKGLLVIPPDILKLTLADSHCPPYAAGAACARPFHQPSNVATTHVLGHLTTMDCDESQCVNFIVSASSRKPKNGFETNRKPSGTPCKFHRSEKLHHMHTHDDEMADEFVEWLGLSPKEYSISFVELHFDQPLPMSPAHSIYIYIYIYIYIHALRVYSTISFSVAGGL